MKSVINNPYRIAGILANSSEKDILKQKNKIKKFSAVGKEISSEYDFPFFPSLQRNSNTIDKAFSDIEQNQNRVFHSLFWFLNINPIDNTAIQYLISGNKEKAMEIWEKLTNEKEVNSKNFSAFNNISTLYLLGNSKEDLKRGVFSKINLIESESFKEFIHSVADETFSIDATKQIEVFVEELLKQFKGKYSTSETLELFSICNGATQKYLSKRFTEEPIHQIEMQIEQCNKKRAKNKSNAYKLGIDLYNNTRSDLTLLKSIVGRANLQYRMLADNVAREILQCSVDYFNASQEEEKDGNYFEDAMKLAKLAETIAVNDATKNKVKENISTLEGMKDREVSLIVEVLKSVKLMYEDNEREIIQEIKKIEENDVFIKLGHKSINWDGVNKNIKNSINWENVNNLLVEILSDENLKKIKESDNIEIKKEFIELANWIKEKSLKSSVISGIIERYKKIIPKLPFRIISSEVTNTDNKPLYTKFIRYIGLNLEVEVYENKTIELYVKYIRPNGSIDHNSQVSPSKYTSSQVEKLTRFKKTINVLGWGNSKKCTYEVGKHRIEVYLDEYMIHSKEFVVDLAPSEKIEKKLIVAESKLKDIKQTTYFALDINVEKNELEEIKKFKLFRGSSEKQRQIETQQLKINELIKHSEAKKAKEIKLQNMRIIELKAKLLETKY